MAVTVADIKKLREETGAGMMDCKKALTAAEGDFVKAQEILREKSLIKADKKSDRETKEGYIASYVHADNKTAALVEILCETDFVALNEKLQEVAKNVAMQVVAMNPADVAELLAQDYIRDGKITIEDLVKETSGLLGEKLVVNRFTRYEIGE
ncbi:MAG: translation elongation factor Ts [Candidatus Pacebacteria bacterium]|jgi:elongation factor Ts|nr:translation elongation factor Ts [Candidatus Paceibacterota bacterium]MBT3511953.1 translation elongation factor Ts [Candidatus Paceibacterota bacterium]MBT4005275.1 translation elongation factor Ts [Candidatus Paceibacterota bacterium]MBT4681142.1 translation elongation factor Ts [Candidatus Paceibacterota bacterium]MBT6898631.1 translation elongation factor Ts [Candidatus Paceibacterota bacterium]